jgi:AraC family transcriptional regulator
MHEAQFIVMMLQPGVMDLSIAGAPTKRLEYVAGDIALCRRHVVGLAQSRDRMQKLRFKISDLYLSEAAGEMNREVELRSIPRLKDLRIRALMTAVNIERASGFPSG